MVKSILQEDTHGGTACRHLGLYFYDRPLGQRVVVHVPAPPANHAKADGDDCHGAVAAPAQFDVSISLLQSYEGFAEALYVSLSFADGRDAIAPVKVSGFHDEHTSVPATLPVATIDSPLVPFNVTCRAPMESDIKDPSAAKIVITGILVSPVAVGGACGYGT